MRLKCGIKGKYNHLSLPLKASFWFMVSNFVQRAVSMITTPFFTRLMSTKEYGITSTFFSWVPLLGIILTLNTGSACLVMLTRREDKERVLSSLTGLMVTISGIFFILLMFFRKIISDIVKLSPLLCLCLFIYVIGENVTFLYYLYKRCSYRYKMVVITTLFVSISTLILGLICIILISPIAEYRIIPATLIVGLVGIVIGCKNLYEGKTYFNKEIWKTALCYGIPLIPHGLAAFILSTSDRLMINHYCGVTDVALYSVAYAVGSIVNLFTSAVNNTFSPYTLQRLKDKNYDSLKKRTNQVLGITLGGLMLVMLFAHEIINIFGGHKYIDCESIIIPICLGVFFNYMFSLMTKVQEFYYKKFSIAFSSIGAALVNIMLNIVFIQLYGYKAAAYTTFFCYLMLCAIQLFFYKRTIQVEMDGEDAYDVKFMVLISVFSIIMGNFITLLNKYTIIKYVVLEVLCIVFLIHRESVKSFIKSIFSQR